MPYDATFRLESLLDCLVFLMGEEYGKFQLASAYKVELLQLGFGFVNLTGRQQWVFAIESLLYNFNIQCKFMMPCKHQSPPLQLLDRFSNQRAQAEETSAATSVVFDNQDAVLN